MSMVATAAPETTSVTERRWPSPIAPLAAMVIIAFVLRIILMYLRKTYLPVDSFGSFNWGVEVSNIARSLAEGHGFSSPFGAEYTGPTAWVSPLYPYLCALIFKVSGVFTLTSAKVIFAINSLFAALTCIPIYMIAERCFGRRCAWISGWLWAVVPFFMRWPVSWVWETSVSALLLSIALLLSLNLANTSRMRTWIGYGVFWGITALTNPALLTFLPISGLYAAYHLHKRRHPWFRPAVVASVMFFVTISPWLVRNRLVFGEWVFLRGNFGFELHLGNYENSNGTAWGGKHPTQNLREYALYKKLGERAYVAHQAAAAKKWIRENPSDFLRLTVRRFSMFWNGDMVLYTRSEWWKPWMMLLLTITTAIALPLTIDRHRPAAWMFLLVILLYPWPYYITYAMARYRHAIEPLMLMVSVWLGLVLVEGVRNLLRTKMKATRALEVG